MLKPLSAVGTLQFTWMSDCFFIPLIPYMTKYSKKEIADFQKLYLRYYGKNLTLEETEKRFDALVRLLRLVRNAFSVEILTESE